MLFYQQTENPHSITHVARLPVIWSNWTIYQVCH